MEAILIQSQRVCPFLKKTSPSTLRSLSTSVAHNGSAGGGKMSNLQMLGRRCPVMGKALAVQSSNIAGVSLSGAFGGARAYHSKVNRKIHTTSEKKARAVDVDMLRHEPGMLVHHRSIVQDY
jgi:5-aminolevulinate synthase